MGLKKGRCIFSEDSLVCSTLNSLRTAIIRRLGADASYHPVVTVDAASWIIAALNNPALDSKVSAQFHAQPPVPVTAVSEYIKKRCDLLKKHKFIPIIVLDGQRFPLKSEENSARQEGSNIEDHFMELYEAYCLSDDHPRDDVFCLRKKTMWPREDVYHDVVNSLQRDGIFAVCAPFEADHQILALQNQGIADAAIAVDTDLPGLGVNYTIKKLTLNGGAYYMCQSKLMNEVLPGRFIEGWNARAQAGPVESPVMSDARNLFCCMLGVDYLRDGLPGSGPVDCTNRMKEYQRLQTDDERQEFVEAYAQNHVNPTAFRRAMFCWKNAPAFIVVPADPDMLPRDAFFSGQYTVELGSMTASPDQRSPDFYAPAEDKLGFLPEVELRNGHPLEYPDGERPSYRDFFTFKYWSRTGSPLEPVEQQRNKLGQIVVPGAIISFEFVSIKHQPTRCLKLWLSARGVPTSDIKDRAQLEDMVRQIDGFGIDALPKFVMRGGGGYVTNAIFEPRDGDNVLWQPSDDAINAIRSEACENFELRDTIEEFFSEQYNSKRLRCSCPRHFLCVIVRWALGPVLTKEV